MAYKDWYAAKYFYDIKFDKDGKCTDYTTTYELIDPSNYEESNEILEGGMWNPVWNAEKTQFTTSRSHSYTEVQDIYDDFDEDYTPYTVYFSDGTSKHYDVPDQAKKDADLLKNIGISKEILVQAGASNPNYHTQTQISIGAYLECADLDIAKLNAYGLALYNAIKAIADDGVMYDYIEYTPIDACPQIESEYNSLMFMYKYNGTKINVSMSIYNNYDTNETKISVAAGKSIW